MESPEAIEQVNDLFKYKNLPLSTAELLVEMNHLGLAGADLKENPELMFEAGIARNYRAACEALDIPVTPHQTLKLAKHMRVGGNNYRTGVALSEHERYIAQRLLRIHFQEHCREIGVAFAHEHEMDVIRMVNFGERGLHMGHKIGEASGCFQLVLIVSIPLLFGLLYCLA